MFNSGKITVVAENDTFRNPAVNGPIIVGLMFELLQAGLQVAAEAVGRAMAFTDGGVDIQQS